MIMVFPDQKIKSLNSFFDFRAQKEYRNPGKIKFKMFDLL